MTVKQLIQELKKLPEDAVVLLSKDSEGNGYSDDVFIQVDPGLSYVKYGRDIELGYSKLTEQLERLGYTEEDVLEEGKSCVVIYP